MRRVLRKQGFEGKARAGRIDRKGSVFGLLDRDRIGKGAGWEDGGKDKGRRSFEVGEKGFFFRRS